MTKKINSRTHKESEALVKSLQEKLWARDKVLSEMRMALYYVNRHLQECHDEIDGMWCHHQDGSDLLVSKSELFNVHQNVVLNKLASARRVVNKPLSRLKEFIGW